MDEKPVITHRDPKEPGLVAPLPDSVRREGGLLLDAEGFDGQLSLKLASDGHVSSVPQIT